MTDEKDFRPMFAPPKNYQIVWLQDIGKRELSKLLKNPVAQTECSVAFVSHPNERGTYRDLSGCCVIGDDAYLELYSNIYRISKTETTMYVFVRKSTRHFVGYVCGFSNKYYRKKEGLPPLSDIYVLTNGIWKRKGEQK
jgi:hypothetical protein